MIIKQKLFDKQFPGEWPFIVPEVAIVAIDVPQDKKPPIVAFVLVHKFGMFALSGLLEQNHFEKLENSRIWALLPGDTRKPLDSFFKYLNDLYGKYLKRFKRGLG